MSTTPNVRVPIESISRESLSWKPQNPELFSRSEVARQTGKYQASIPAKISSWSANLDSELASVVEDASRKILEFEKHAQLKLGQTNPALGPMSAILLRTESSSSSQIEKLTTSAKQLALAELNEDSRANSRTVLGNVRAMEAAIRLASDLSENTILAMHKELMRHQHQYPEKDAGHYRQEQVWIGGSGAGPISADFVPPSFERIKPAMADLISFLKREDLPVLVQAAVGHAQFETIHPFTDGNGRTGRALVQSILRNKRIVNSMATPISAGLLIRVRSYFNALSSFRSGDAGPIILEICSATQASAVSGKKLVDDLSKEIEISKEKLSGVRADAAALKVIPFLIAQPVINSQYLTKTLGLGEMAALRALDLLEERGVIQELTGWRRRRIWEHRGILTILDDYGQTIKRAGLR